MITNTQLPIRLERLDSNSTEERYVVYRGNLQVGYLVKPKPERGYDYGWKAFKLDWNNRVIGGSCKTFFGRDAKNEAIEHAADSKI